MFSCALFLGHIAISAFIALFACSAGGPQLQALQLAYNLEDILINISFFIVSKFLSDTTWDAPRRLTRIQSDVLPTPIKPPTFVKNVCSLMLNLARDTAILWSNVMCRLVV